MTRCVGMRAKMDGGAQRRERDAVSAREVEGDLPRERDVAGPNLDLSGESWGDIPEHGALRAWFGIEIGDALTVGFDPHQIYREGDHHPAPLIGVLHR